MNILSIYYTHKPGGLCKRLYRLLQATQDQGHSLCHLCLDPQLLPESLHASAQRIPFPLSKRSGLLFWILFSTWAPCYAAYIARQRKVDRLLCFQAYYSALFLPTRLLSRKPLVLFLRSLVFQINRLKEVPQPLLFLADLFEKIGLRNADGLVYLTKHMQKEIHGFAFHEKPPAHAIEHILPNDLPVIVSSSSVSRQNLLAALLFPSSGVIEKQWLLSSGVLDKRKNISLLLKVMKEIPKAERPILFIAGEGPDKQALEAEARSSHLSEVIFTGWREDLSDWVTAADIILFPSLHEGISNALLEALALKKLVLLSDIPEHRELELPERSHFSAQSLAKLLTELQSDPSLRSSLIEAQQKRASAFSFAWEDRGIEILLKS